MTVDRRTMLKGAGVASAALAMAGEATVAAERAAGPPPKSYRRIATEEAFATPEQVEAMAGIGRGNWDALDFVLWRTMTNAPAGAPSATRGASLHDRLLDLDAGRIKAMDDLGVTMMVLSLTAPGVQMFTPDVASTIAARSNDILAEAIRRHPTRFAGLGAFAPHDPKRAVKEMERCIRTLGFNGFILNSHTNGEYLDNPKYWPILEAAEALDAPIYIHPRCPPDQFYNLYQDYRMESSTWGFNAETGYHGVRMLVSGVFDRFPKLKIVLGHMGEGIPYFLWRIDYTYNALNPIKMKLKPSEYFKRNFAITTSGLHSNEVLDYVIKVLGIDRVMWAIDYPYQAAPGAVDFMNNAPVSDAERAALFHINAERIFKIRTS